MTYGVGSDIKPAKVIVYRFMGWTLVIKDNSVSYGILVYNNIY